jgi:ring-1,2-phenylacetyl-CoA epoxidase subunit PaaE
MDQIFICGPKEMIFLTKDFLENKGIASKKIHFELFAGTPLKKQPISNVVKDDDSPKCSVALQIDGRTIEFSMPFDGDSILDRALQEGADLPFACKGGVCCTCKAKLIEGNIEMEVNYALEPEEVAQGYILTCQSRPTTHKVVIDFDVK